MWLCEKEKQNKTKTETIKLDITLLEEKRLCTQSFLFFLWETKLFPNIQSCLCKDVCSRAEWTNLWVLSVFFLYLRWHETNRARWFSFFFFLLCFFVLFLRQMVKNNHLQLIVVRLSFRRLRKLHILFGHH